MSEFINREFIYLWYYFSVQLEQIFPYWALGIVIGSFISVFFKNKIHGLFASINQHKIGIAGNIVASIIGIISPLCMYGTVPSAASFAQKGMRQDWLTSFMMSSILLNPQLMLYSAALGTRVLIIRIVSCLICGIIAGLLIRYFYRNKSFYKFDGFKEPTNRDIHPNPIWRLLSNIWRNIKATGLYFLIGILLSALFQRYISLDAFVSLFGDSNRAFGVLMGATIGVPLYMCGGGTIPLLMVWLEEGMSYGAATAFMITGPATKITNLGALKIILGMRHFVFYLVFIILFALLSGTIINIIF